jgi:hypothetical protein
MLESLISPTQYGIEDANGYGYRRDLEFVDRWDKILREKVLVDEKGEEGKTRDVEVP